MSLIQLGDRQVSGVMTTGIYCRAGCGGRPKPSNTSVYRSAVAAQAAGFRPCLSCRPDRRADMLIDGSTPEVVRQSLMLITDGYMDECTTDDLGRRLGISARHLNRLFTDHLGATPALVAQSRRAHFARRLLDETDLPVAEISSASGFKSVRQMNRVMLAVFRFTPKELRKKRRKSDRLVADGGLRLRVPCPSDFDFGSTLRYLQPRAIPGVESVVDGVYGRVTNTCGYPGVIEVSEGAEEGSLDLVAHLSSFTGLLGDVARCRTLFGMVVDYSEAREHLSDDPILAPLIASRPGLPIPGSWDRFETAIRVVLEQQETVTRATTLVGKITRELGVPVPGLTQMELGFLFPSAERLAGADLEACGISNADSMAVRGISEAVADGSLDLYDHRELPDLLTHLQRIPGIGHRAAEMMAMRVFGHMDVLPSDELKTWQLDPDSMRRWSPWRSLAFAYLLDSRRDPTDIDAAPAPTLTTTR